MNDGGDGVNEDTLPISLGLRLGPLWAALGLTGLWRSGERDGVGEGRARGLPEEGTRGRFGGPRTLSVTANCDRTWGNNDRESCVGPAPLLDPEQPTGIAACRDHAGQENRARVGLHHA